MNNILKLIKWLRNNVDALALGAFFAVLPLMGDIVWWHRDFLLGEWTWHLGVILFTFSSSLIGSIVALIWYHKSKDKQFNALLKRIKQLEKNI